MSREAPGLGWDSLFWEARGYLGLEDEEPVPLDELRETAVANGWSEREFRNARRNTDRLVNVGTLDEPRLFLDATAANTTDTAADSDHAEAHTTVAAALGAGVSVTEDSGGSGGVRLAGEDTQTADVRSGWNADETGSTDVETLRNTEKRGSWDDAEWTSPEPDTYAPAWTDRAFWMGHKPGDKAPFAPWADRNAAIPCDKHDEPTTSAECGHDARFKWGHTDNWTTFDEAREWADKHPDLAGLVALIDGGDDPYTDDPDPFAFVDGDDVRCPETGEVHPGFIDVLDRLGPTYADVSTSGAGVHALYRGALPEGVKQAKVPIDDEPWGANDDVPVVEIYDHKKVCVVTGDHVPGTGLSVELWDDDALEAFLDEHDKLPDPEDQPKAARERFDLEDHDPTATEADETTDDIRDIFAALDRLDARRVAEKTIVHSWNDSAPTSGDKRAFRPVWGPNCNGTANVVDREIWQDTGGGGYGGPVAMALIDAGERRPDETRPPRGETWWRGVEHLRDLGFSIPEYIPSGGSAAETDPLGPDVVVEPGAAWRAAEAVTPDDLTPDADRTLSLPTTDSGAAWRHDGVPLPVVRAVALEEGIIDDPTADLDVDEHDRAYNLAREGYGAPLPEYVTAADATDRWAVVEGALEQLDHYHLDHVESEVTGDGGDDDAIIAELDPSWTDSASGHRIVAFRSGGLYCRDHERPLDPVRFVALEEGIIPNCDADLEGEAFHKALRATRARGAPLPEYDVGDPDHVPVLPPAEDLLGAFSTDKSALDEAREDVEALHQDLATAGDDAPARVLQSLPATGKTTAAIKTAAENPTLYAAPRKELQAAALEKANRWGVDAMVLPVLAEEHVRKEAVAEGVHHVFEDGKDLLRDPTELRERVEAPLLDEDAEDDTDDVDLDRAVCPTADGHNGEVWQLAIAVAKALGHTPREIHANGQALFGERPPCCGEVGGEPCPYSRAWERATDPDNSVDLLVGHYAHVHVDGARTHYDRDGERVKTTPRAVVIDEFPGDAYAEDYGEAATDHATWLAGCFHPAIEDRHGLIQRSEDLADDDLVQAWLRGEADRLAAVREAEKVLDRVHGLDEAARAAADVLDAHPAAAEELGVRDALERLRNGVGNLDPTALAEIYAALDAATAEREVSEATYRVRERIADDMVSRVADAAADLDGPVAGLPDRLDVLDDIHRDLAGLVTAAVDAVVDRQGGVFGMIDAAQTALAGGRDGCRALALHARDGRAHPDAGPLLYGVMSDEETIATTDFVFGDDRSGGTTLNRAELDDTTILFDRNEQGATVHDPPPVEAAGGGRCPIIGLDATARAPLWETALGRPVETADIHETPRHRRAFLRDVLNLQVVQTSPHANYYEGSVPNLGGDEALLRAIGREFTGGRFRQDRLSDTTAPAVITTKGVREALEPKTGDVVAAFEHYGNLTGSNALSHFNLGAVLGTQHYGDASLERFAALAGEEVTRTGRGMNLDYGSDVANEYLRLMREDQTFQAILRFGRDEEGALVFAHTAALRDDLPVVADGDMVRAFSEGTREVAEAAAERTDRRFSVDDLMDDVDVDRRTVQRALDELTELGHLDRHDPGEGRANTFRVQDDPGTGTADLPDIEGAAEEVDPDEPVVEYYTWSVGVREDSLVRETPRRAATSQLPPPGRAEAAAPPD